VRRATFVAALVMLHSVAHAGSPATHFSVVAASPVTVFAQDAVTITALDVSNNTDTAYAGTVNLTSSDPQVVYSSGNPVTLVNGTGTFNVVFKVAGQQTVTATDSVTASITGTSNSVTVNPGATVRFILSAPGSTGVATAFNFTVTAVDLNNNTTPAYIGTLHFTSSDGAAILPADATLTNGAGTFSATLNTTGNQTITTTDTVSASVTGTSGTISVAATPVTLQSFEVD